MNPEDEVRNHLKEVPVFENLPDRAIRSVQALCHIRQYQKDEIIFHHGDPGATMFVILEGNVEIFNDTGPAVRTYAKIKTGDFFGDLALLVDLPRTASARATSFTRLACFARPDFLAFVTRNPNFGNRILMNMSRLIGTRLVFNNQELERLQNLLLESGITDEGAPSDPSGAEK